MNNIIVLDIPFNFGYGEEIIHPVLLQDESDLILIDCGYPGFLPLIEKAALKKGIDLCHLTKVIITHHDHDHMGSLAEIRRIYPSVLILSSREDEPFIEGEMQSLRLKQAMLMQQTLPPEQKEFGKSFIAMLERVEPALVNVTVQDNDYFPWCGGCQIIATPGHMPGHISLYLKEHKTLILGDALVIENGSLTLANPQFTLDLQDAKQSVQKLMEYDIETIICYHGGTMSFDTDFSFQQAISKIIS